MQEVKFEQSWNKKRILITILATLAVGGALYAFRGSIFPQSFLQNNKKENSLKKSVLSQKSEPDLQQILEKQIESIKKETGNINIEEIASSSSQVQKIINDIKNLQNLPKDKAKEACYKICSGL